MRNTNGNKALPDMPKIILMHIWHAYKKIRYFLGRVLVHNFMRRIVRWYDKRHGYYHPAYSSIQDAALKEELEKMKRNATLSQKHIDELQKQLKESEQKIGQLISKTNSLENETCNLRLKITTMEREKKQVQELLEQSSNELDEVRKRAMPAEYVPRTILYAESDASSCNLRKSTISKQPSSLFEIHTMQGDLTQGEFYVLNSKNVQAVISNRNIALSACKIESISSGANFIETISPGKVQKDGKQWKVIIPAIIRLISK